MHSLLRGFLDLLYPPRCEVCGRLRREPICDECGAAIERIAPPMCQICGEPFDPLAQGAPTCQRCRSMGRRPYICARSAALYIGPLAEAIQRFKYHGQMVLARPLGEIMVDAIDNDLTDLFTPVDVVCPVPLHSSRQRERGFNQSELLAEMIAEALNKPLKLLLERTRATLPQVDLPAASRAANVRDAFTANLREEINGKQVLLIDDLFTTGATLSECSRALRRAGAAGVSIFTLARPIPQWRRPAADIQAIAPSNLGGQTA